MPRPHGHIFARWLPWLLGLLFLAPAPGLAAAPEVGAWLTSELGQMKPRLGYQAEHQGDQKTTDHGGGLGFTQHELRGSTPLWQNSSNDLSLSGRARYMDLDTPAKLPSGKSMPAELWDLNLSAQFRHRLDNDVVLGLAARGGSASDKPFHSDGESQYGATAFARLPSGQHGAWLVLVNYDNNREIITGMPLIPGAGYWYAPSKQFQVLAGVPFSSLRYRPLTDLDLSLSYVMTRTLRARATYHLAPPLSVYTGFEMFHQSYLLADRPRSENRLFFYQKRALAGTSYELGRGLVLDISGGWAFDRFFFQGENYGDRWQDRLSLEDGAFFAGQVGYRF
ncbi:MAG: hypothetical protein HY794_03745 [Desulfarculus sp.]|nr:hypothetical protein [Desulfarculus sp.]